MQFTTNSEATISKTIDFTQVILQQREIQNCDSKASESCTHDARTPFTGDGGKQV